VQQAWLALFRLGLSKKQRKIVLGLVSSRIAPYFVKVELLMDFLTDSFNAGGSTSLLALSGLYYLIQEKNLDYPMFYQKLYSLLDAGILHSRQRSRFFRLLDTFLASTHLPAALVASFIKKLSRLILQAPPASIVVVVPWIYNLLKRHPTCTFMVHREIHGKDRNEQLRNEGMNDPFDPSEEDPMKTDAISSSLWEVEMLQSHYHPNVATLARIISEQFTKHAYNMEDFLDHSYATVSVLCSAPARIF
jgi:U3 small nucleolar RNA-associated protein 19